MHNVWTGHEVTDWLCGHIFNALMLTIKTITYVYLVLICMGHSGSKRLFNGWVELVNPNSPLEVSYLVW